jgi:hypothetical protein
MKTLPSNLKQTEKMKELGRLWNLQGKKGSSSRSSQRSSQRSSRRSDPMDVSSVPSDPMDVSSVPLVDVL